MNLVVMDSQEAPVSEASQEGLVGLAIKVQLDLAVSIILPNPGYSGEIQAKDIGFPAFIQGLIPHKMQTLNTLN